MWTDITMTQKCVVPSCRCDFSLMYPRTYENLDSFLVISDVRLNRRSGGSAVMLRVRDLSSELKSGYCSCHVTQLETSKLRTKRWKQWFHDGAVSCAADEVRWNPRWGKLWLYTHPGGGDVTLPISDQVITQVSAGSNCPNIGCETEISHSPALCVCARMPHLWDMCCLKVCAGAAVGLGLSESLVALWFPADSEHVSCQKGSLFVVLLTCFLLTV